MLKLDLKSELEMWADAVYFLPERLILRKEFPVPCDTITIVPNNDTCRNGFSSLRCNNVISVWCGSFSGAFLLIRRDA
jgi:hypothetical protein